MSNHIIITNNPMCKDFAQAIFYDETLLQILTRVRDYIHLRHRLVTHPLAGSIKPNQTPYKSVAITSTPEDKLCLMSLQIIEHALTLSGKLLQDRAIPLWNNRTVEDFALIDMELLKSGMESIR